MSKLERKFAEIVHDPTLKPLLQVTQGLMRFLPSSHITADEALDLFQDWGSVPGIDGGINPEPHCLNYT